MKTEPEYQKTTISRGSEEDLNIAIKELELRGFKLVKSDSNEEEYKTFDVSLKRDKRLKYSDHESRVKHTALMERWYDRPVKEGKREIERNDGAPIA